MLTAALHAIGLAGRRAALVAICLTPLAARAQVSPASVPTAAVVVSGSSTVYPLMADISARFRQLHPEAKIELRSNGSGNGVTDLRAGTCDIAMVSRPVADNERDLFAFPIARDGAAIVVHRSNPVKGLNGHQLADILVGNVTNWKQVGGRPGQIRVAWRSEGQGVPEILLRQLRLKNQQIRSQATFFENADAVKFASGDRNALAVAALGVAERSVKSGMAVKLVAYDGVEASSRTVRDHTYALSRPLILLTRSVPTGLPKRLIDYAVSSAVADLHVKHGFVPYQE